jgi:hypothetical protein
MVPREASIMTISMSPATNWRLCSPCRQKQTLKWTARALVQDKLLPESEKNLHSSSVVDLFCCLNDVCTGGHAAHHRFDQPAS